MKKFFTLALITLSLVSSAFASNNEKVNNRAVAHLEANYAGAKNVTWTYTEKFEKASMYVGQEKVDVYYDSFGELMGTTKTMAFDKLPKSALEILTTEYTFPDYQLTDCIEYTDTDNNKSYFVSFDLDNERIIVSISANGSVSLV